MCKSRDINDEGKLEKMWIIRKIGKKCMWEKMGKKIV